MLVVIDNFSSEEEMFVTVAEISCEPDNNDDLDIKDRIQPEPQLQIIEINQ